MRSVRWMSLPLGLGLGLAFLLGGCSLATAVDRDLIIEQDSSVKGSLAVLAADQVSGWAFIVGQEAPVQVRIEINGAVEGTAVADEMRPDLVDQGHPTGEAKFTLAPTPDLETGDEVSAFVVGSEVELTNSPRTF